MPESGCYFVIQQIEQITDGIDIRFTFLMNNVIISFIGYIQDYILITNLMH